MAARKREQFEKELNRIEAEGVVFDRCSFCAATHRQCRITLSLRARQRAFHCLECFRRSRKCSHGEPGSPFLALLKDMQEEEDLKAGSFAARRRERLRLEEEQDEKERRAEVLRVEEAAAKRRELEVRADEAATQREVIRGQLRLQELSEQGRKRATRPAGSMDPVVEEISD